MRVAVPVDSANVYLLSGLSLAGTLFREIEKAKRSIDLSAFALACRWPRDVAYLPDIFAALCRASQRDVRCRAILATHSPTSPSSKTNWKSAPLLADAGWLVKRSSARRVAHTKLVIIDGAAAFIGSHNLSPSAFERNWEISVGIVGAPAVAPFAREFQAEWSRY